MRLITQKFKNQHSTNRYGGAIAVFKWAGNKFFKIAALPQRHAAAYELLGLRRCG
jgi:hypothetical protein